MRRLEASLAWLVAMLVSGCRGKTTSEPDASVPKEARAPWVATVAVRGVGAEASLTRLKDDGLILRTGPYLYAIDRDGAIARIGAPADYPAFLEKNDVEIGGPNLRSVIAGREEISGTLDAPFIRLRHWVSAPPNAPRPVLAWNGSTWTPATAEMPPPEDDQRTLQQKLVTDLPAEYGTCHPLDSADHRVYVECTSMKDGKEERSFYQREGERWTPFPLASTGRNLQVIDAEGTLWYLEAVAGVGMVVGRVAKGGTAEEVELPPPPPALVAPSYRARGDRNYASWENASFVPAAPPIRMRSPHSIVVRSSGDVWVIGQDSGADSRLGSSVVRFTRGEQKARAPLLLRSETDQRNEIQNARGLRKWKAGCNTAFVPFPVDGGKEFFAAHEKELEAAVAKIDQGAPQRPPIQVATVEGHFDERRVMGVVFVRNEPTASPQTMGAAVARVTKIATTRGPGPEVTCSIPMLDAILALLH